MTDDWTATPDAPVRPSVVCLATDGAATEALRDALEAILPQASVEGADPEVLRDAPNSDAVIIAVGALARSAAALVRDLRARGFANAILVIADDPALLPDPALDLLGVQRTIATANLATRLPGVLADVLGTQARIQASPEGQRLLAALRRLQAVVAAGQLAARLQHRLNNPLAALLAEAQLLELEALPPDHATSVRRIIELCRRVIDETKSIEGLASAEGAPRTERGHA
jgi:signal transduction histidine kinase